MNKLYVSDMCTLSYPVGNNMKSAFFYAEEAAKKFREIYPPGNYVNVFCRGSSGAILASLFYAMLPDYEITIVHIKKDGESSHGDKVSTRFNSYHINVIIDDIIATGETMREIWNAIESYTTDPIKINALIILRGYDGDYYGFSPEYLITRY